jgi:uncharacterized protein (DUF305 family)
MRKSLIILVSLLVAFVPILPVTADGPVEGRAGRAELRFLEGMIDHHQMAVDMANDCLANAPGATVRALCQRVIDAQSAEIAQMQTWLLDWYNVQYTPIAMIEPMGEMGGMAGMDHSTMTTDGPVTDPPMMMGMMAGLNRLDGVDYEIAWLESMIDHHDDALHMAERILTRAEHADLIVLAETIIRDQTAEMAEMEALIVASGA